MRRRLERFFGKRIVVVAIFQRFVKQTLANGRIVRCMLIIDVRDMNGRLLTPHMWLQLKANETIKVSLERGDVIQFSAEVNKYAKHSKRRPIFDYGLIKPRDIQVIEEATLTEQEALNKRPAWEVIKGLRRVTPAPKPEPWPRLFRVEYDLSNLKTRNNSIQSQIMRKEKQNIYGVQFDSTGFVATSDGLTYETLTDLTNILEQRGEYTLTWQDEEQEA